MGNKNIFNCSHGNNKMMNDNDIYENSDDLKLCVFYELIINRNGKFCDCIYIEFANLVKKYLLNNIILNDFIILVNFTIDFKLLFNFFYYRKRINEVTEFILKKILYFNYRNKSFSVFFLNTSEYFDINKFYISFIKNEKYLLNFIYDLNSLHYKILPELYFYNHYYHNNKLNNLIKYSMYNFEDYLNIREGMIYYKYNLISKLIKKRDIQIINSFFLKKEFIRTIIKINLFMYKN